MSMENAPKVEGTSSGTSALSAGLVHAESAWLVEWNAHGYGPQWWGFNHAPGSHSDWCADANNAVRFARQEDAERMRLHIIAVKGMTGRHDYERSITATEHAWPN